MKKFFYNLGVHYTANDSGQELESSALEER